MDQVETGGVGSEIGEFAFLKLTVCERLKRKYEVANMLFWTPQTQNEFRFLDALASLKTMLDIK